MLVMGASSHSRVRELLLGGVTRHVLSNVTVHSRVHRALSAAGRVLPLGLRPEGSTSGAEREDTADDAAHGADRRGDELPGWVADKQARLARLRAAKAALEAAASAAAPPPDAEPGPSSGMSDHGRPRRAPDGAPPERAQRNFTDPDSPASSRPGTASSRATTASSRAMPATRSSSPSV